ncbi:MAG TPA: arginine--tRNA ligase, partial [Candidatus Binataceae bacterium]|nr:arginine--tRNA ligase [Candidatus Binataceae bacterium]
MKDLIVATISAAIARAHAAGKLKSSAVSVTVEAPKDAAHGDIATNAALAMGRAEGKPPRAIAEIIREHIEVPAEIGEVSVAGPGFINFRMAPLYWHREMRAAVAQGETYFRPRKWTLADNAPARIQVEFLSANPTGPLTVGHGRNAVLGDTIARLYEMAGFDVTREYYFNNGGRQMRLLGESVRARYLQELGREASLPEDGYQGEYIRDIARALKNEQG